MPDREFLQLRVLDDGSVSIVDPDPTILELIKELNAGYALPHPVELRGAGPRLHRTRARRVAVAVHDLADLSDDQLWSLQRPPPRDAISLHGGGASCLDVKCEISSRMLRACTLCRLECRVDRFSGQRGRCGLGTSAFVHEEYVHVAEELGPTLNISLRGCGMRCRFCQQHRALDPRSFPGKDLSPFRWRELDTSQARSLAFVGGNPTESLPAILHFLREAPADLHVPIVWNCSGYDSVRAIRLLDGICDAYVPDFKFGSDRCAVALANAPGYVENALRVVEAMCAQNVPVIVRILVLPGHADCCHLPVLALLESARTDVLINVMEEYSPDFRITLRDGPLATRSHAREIARIRAEAERRGFQLY